MKRIEWSPYLWIVVTVFLLLSLPLSLSERVREAVIATCAPYWKYLHKAKGKSQGEEFESLLLENYLLKRKLERLKHLGEKEETLFPEYVIGKVIYRSPSSWNSSFWLDVGRKDNRYFGVEVVAKDSPVVVGHSLVGVVDYVGEKQCRVRLITDSGLHPSVRAQRGAEGLNLVNTASSFLKEVLPHEALVLDSKQSMSLTQALHDFCAVVGEKKELSYMAKGELQGRSAPLWQQKSQHLRGIGFNYDFSDDKGPARDLRTGTVVGQEGSQRAEVLIQPGDLLVTTGMDGVFPEGLEVARVVTVNPLKEGDYYYSLDALPIAPNLETLTRVYVIPPVGFNQDDQPPFVGG